MYQYYIFIINKSADGEYSHDVKWAYDENEKLAYNKAKNIYFDELSKAAINDMLFTSVILVSADGLLKRCECERHDNE